MVVIDGGYGAWALRLEQACGALLPEARWLQADVGGPLDVIRRMIASGIWGRPFADELYGAVCWLDEQIVAWGQHLSRLHNALDQAAREAEAAARLEAAGIVPSTFRERWLRGSGGRRRRPTFRWTGRLGARGEERWCGSNRIEPVSWPKPCGRPPNSFEPVSAAP